MKLPLSNLDPYMRKQTIQIWQDFSWDWVEQPFRWAVFCVDIQETTKQFVPMTKPPKKRKKPLWMTTELLGKQAAHHRSTWILRSVQRYAWVRNELKWLCRKAAIDHERNIAGDAKTTQKQFSAMASRKWRRSMVLPTWKKTDGVRAFSSKDKADVLNKFFSSVFTKEDKYFIPDFKRTSYNEPLWDLIITPEQVLKRLK